MAFHEIRFPANLSFGSVGGPERRTEIVSLASGFEERNTPWAHSKRRYEAGSGARTLDDIAAIIAFFEARSGKLHSFRWKDWTDYKSCLPSQKQSPLDQLVGLGDGVETTFQLSKTYRSGEQSYTRIIKKPVQGTVLVSISNDPQSNGREFSVDHEKGTIVFLTPPSDGTSIHAGFEFDVPVRFDTDLILASIESLEAGELPEIPVVEVRV